jgi:putative transcriptional regulator
MIRIHFAKLLDDKAFRENRRITIVEVANETGLSRSTLTRLSTQRGYNARLDAIDVLCGYLDCQPGDLLEYLPNTDISTE